MSDDLSTLDSFHLIVQLPQDVLEGWETGGWVAVESFSQEREARDRFHDLRPALDALGAGAAMIRGIAQTATWTVSHDKTVISRDAEFWTLRSAEIRMAGPELLDLWRREADRLLAEAAASARYVPRPAATPVLSKRAAAMIFGSVVAAMVVATTLFMPATPSDQATISLVRHEGTTLLMPDPKDPNFTIEFELRPDGSRAVVARYPKGHRPEPQDGGDAKRPRTLAEGITMFLRVRQ